MLSVILDILILICKSIIFFILFLIGLLTLLVIAGAFLSKQENARREKFNTLYAEAEEKCVVRLIAVGPEKIQVIKALRDFIDCDLTTAKTKVEAELPVILSYAMQLKLSALVRIYYIIYKIILIT